MNTNLRNALFLLFAFLLIGTLSARSSNAQTNDSLHTTFSIPGTVNTMTCPPQGKCIITLEVTMKKGTSLLSETIPSRGSSLVLIGTDSTMINYEDREYSFVSKDSLFTTTKVSEVRKQVRELLREPLGIE